jgi:hypothetical protein
VRALFVSPTQYCMEPSVAAENRGQWAMEGWSDGRYAGTQVPRYILGNYHGSACGGLVG